MKTWIDSETGRQVVRVASQPYATLPYFRANIFSSDGREATCISAQGLHLLDLKNFNAELLVPARGVELQCIDTLAPDEPYVAQRYGLETLKWRNGPYVNLCIKLRNQYDD
ncbi:MAG: hypothetical protein ABW202_21770 [Duganella sp.]